MKPDETSPSGFEGLFVEILNLHKHVILLFSPVQTKGSLTISPLHCCDVLICHVVTPAKLGVPYALKKKNSRQ